MNLLESFYYKYININFNDFPKLGINFPITKVLFFIVLILIGAAIFVNITESRLSLILKKLIRTESIGEKNAKPLKSLGLRDDKLSQRILSREGGMASKLISMRGKTRMTYEECIEADKQSKLAKKQKRKNFFARILRGKHSGDDRNKISDELAQEPTLTEPADVSSLTGNAPSDFSNGQISDEAEDHNELNKADYTPNDIEDASDITSQGFTKTTPAVQALPEENIDSSAAAQSPYLANGKIDFDKAEFYIKEDKLELSKRYFERKSSTVTKTVLSCIILAGGYIASIFLMPSLLSAINSLLGG